MCRPGWHPPSLMILQHRPDDSERPVRQNLPMARRVSSPALVGRKKELETLGTALRGATASEACAVLITGEAGIGKTRLLAEFQRACQHATFAVGHCLELAPGELAFAPWLEALASLPIRGPDETLPADVEFAELLDSSTTAPGRAGRRPETSRARLFVAARRLLRAAAIQGPLIIALEDLQWASRSTIELFEFLAAALRDERILLLGTLRIERWPVVPQRDDVESLLREFEHLPRCEVVALSPLTARESRELVSAITGDAQDPAVIEGLVNRGHGNPLFIEEFAAFVAAGGEGVPESLRSSLMARLRELSPAGRLVLELMAVAGRSVPYRLIESASGVRGDELVAAVRDLTSHAFVSSDVGGREEIALRHSLVAETILEEMLPIERRQRHGQLADALIETATGLPTPSASSAELAHHLEAAGRFEAALSAAIVAGRAAFRTTAHAEADRHFADALRLREAVSTSHSEAAEDRTPLLMEAAEAAFAAGEGERAVALIHAALDASGSPANRQMEGSLRRRLGTYLLSVLRDDEAVAELRRALDLIPSEPRSSERARALGTLGAALMLGGRYRESQRLCEGALEAARSVGDTYLAGQALSFLGVDLVNIGELARGLEVLREAVKVARKAARAEGVFEAIINLSEMLNRTDLLAEAVAVALAALPEADEEGLTRRIGTGLRATAAGVLIRSGRWQAAAALINEGLALMATGEWLAALLANRARLHINHGRFAEAREDVDRAIGVAHSERVDLWPVLAAVAAELNIWCGDLPEARDMVQRGLAALTDTDADQLRSPLLAVAARIEADDAERCRALRLRTPALMAEMAAEHLRQAAGKILTSASLPQGIRAELACCRAEAARALGKPDPDPWHAAAGLWGAVGQPYNRAYAQFREGEALLALGGNRSSARQTLREALGTARDLGAIPLQQLLLDLARRARLDLTPPRRPEPVAMAAGLSGRETEVLRLIADGLTNRGIAAALFISEATVATHVSHILRKLGVASRLEAGRAARHLVIATPDTPLDPR